MSDLKTSAKGAVNENAFTEEGEETDFADKINKKVTEAQAVMTEAKAKVENVKTKLAKEKNDKAKPSDSASSGSNNQSNGDTNGKNNDKTKKLVSGRRLKMNWQKDVQEIESAAKMTFSDLFL